MSACIKIPEWLKNSPSGKQKKSALNCSCVIGSIVGVTNHRGQEFVFMHDRSFPRCGTPAWPVCVTASWTESNGVRLGSSGSWYIVSCFLHQASFFPGTSSFVWGVLGFRRQVLSQDLLSNIFSWFKVLYIDLHGKTLNVQWTSSSFASRKATICRRRDLIWLS